MIHSSDLKSPSLLDRSDDGYTGFTVLCPVCGFAYQRPKYPVRLLRKGAERGSSPLESANDDEAVIPFSGECGSSWELVLTPTKGVTEMTVRVLSSCRRSS